VAKQPKQTKNQDGSAPVPEFLMRIVSLAPNITAILVELGAQDALVGITRRCKDALPPAQTSAFQHLALLV
jgi:ABC-type hemin transport system substrate-binding protein